MNAQTPSLKIGVVAAMAAEAALLPARGVRPGQLASMEGGHVLILSGMGPVAAAVAAEQLVAAGVQALLVFGVAGALDPRLRNGELCCPASVVDEHGQRHLCDRVWREQLLQRLLPSGLGWHPRQQLLSVEQPLLTGDDKSAAFARGCVAVDMESAAVAAVAARHGLPLLVLRAIVDEANDSIPQALNGSVDAYGRPRMLGLLAALGRQPSLCAELPRLYSRMQGATRSLRSAARAAGPSWAWPH